MRGLCRWIPLKRDLLYIKCPQVTEYPKGFLVWQSPQLLLNKPYALNIDNNKMCMEASWHGNAFCMTGPLWRKSTAVTTAFYTRVINAQLWGFFLYCPKQKVELSIISITVLVIWCHCYQYCVPSGLYRKTSSKSRTKSQDLNVSNLVLQMYLLNPLKSGVKSRMKM